ncbi:MAG: hypothetical protein HQL66_06215 [Magnetococcales bacterium]|nr:hypothetical protein [Magnetococcales bacterium]
MGTLRAHKVDLHEALENAGMVALMGLVFAAVPLLAAWAIKGMLQLF